MEATPYPGKRISLLIAIIPLLGSFFDTVKQESPSCLDLLTTNSSTGIPHPPSSREWIT